MLVESSRAVQDAFPKPSRRIPLAIQFAWSLILCIGMFFLPETPRFLIKKGKDRKAIKSLTFLRRLPPVHAALLCEFEEIQGNWEYEKSLGKASYIECFRGNVGKRTITSIVLQRLQQLVGVNFINPNSGLPNAFTLQVITEVVNVATTFPGLYAIDKFGRRFVLLSGALGMGSIPIHHCRLRCCHQPKRFGLAGRAVRLRVHILLLLRLDVRPGCLGGYGRDLSAEGPRQVLEFDDCSQLVLQLAAPFIKPRLEGDYANLGSNVFWILGGFCWIAVVFVYFMVTNLHLPCDLRIRTDANQDQQIYETKDMTLEQVNELYENVKFAPKSASYHAAFYHLSSVGASGTPLPRPGKDSTDQSTEKNEGY
ncbi:hypothetical protein D0869_03558 [Hortaea werneckii]|uniref:Major facilitator superfamily (MFS) profile domain-containing protein n=1 Tax=Hortaea werneckii TaxID=91943 RepID=A0A3M6X4K4_HORWE|nr:hypothetical protein D0869_03558 [Hortaea werneckii]